MAFFGQLFMYEGGDDMKTNFFLPRLVIFLLFMEMISTGGRVMAAEKGSHAQKPVTSAGDLLTPYRGRVLLLLMGMPGCPGTERATTALSLYATKKPDGVAILRIDVPSPDGELPSCGQWNAPFRREEDRNREIAGKLGFFYYPTFYILDRDGEVRFSGEYVQGDVEKMISDICSEEKGAPKHVFNPPMPRNGTIAEVFQGTTLEQKTVDLKELCRGKGVFLFFGSTSCPFSKKATGELPGLEKDYKARGVTFTIVNRGPADREVKNFYGGSAPGIQVLIDPEGAIGEKKFGVRTVPFFYLLDGEGRVLQREPFTAGAARSALNTMLNIKSTDGGTKKPGAG
jgi:thiol-disulfide isomerase/thioredoxin